MNKSEFLELITDKLEIEDEVLGLDSDLTSFSEYDSLAVMTLIAIIDENFGVKLSTEAFGSVSTVGSLINLIGEERFS